MNWESCQCESVSRRFNENITGPRPPLHAQWCYDKRKSRLHQEYAVNSLGILFCFLCLQRNITSLLHKWEFSKYLRHNATAFYSASPPFTVKAEAYAYYSPLQLLWIFRSPREDAGVTWRVDYWGYVQGYVTFTMLITDTNEEMPFPIESHLKSFWLLVTTMLITHYSEVYFLWGCETEASYKRRRKCKQLMAC